MQLPMSDRDWDKRLAASRRRMFSIRLEGRENAAIHIQTEIGALTSYLAEMPEGKIAKTKELIAKYEIQLAKYAN